MHPLCLITACSRPENLPRIAKSLDEHLTRTINWLWVIVPDEGVEIPEDVSARAYRVTEVPEIVRPAWSSNAKIIPTCHYGKPLLNHGMDVLAQIGFDGMVGFLDDDTLIHPNFPVVYHDFAKRPTLNGFTVWQVEQKGERLAYRLKPDGCAVLIDTGCFFAHTELIGAHRHPCLPGGDAREYHEGDQLFFRKIYRGRESEWIHYQAPASIYNALR